MIKLGMYGSYFGKDDPKTLPYVEDVIDFAYELKLDVVDFRADVGFRSQDLDYLRAIKIKCLKAGLPIGYLATGGHFVGTEDELQEKMARCKADLDTAVFLGAPMVRSFCGPTPETDEGQAREVECFQELCDAAAEKGIIVGVQNHPCTGDGVLQLLRETDRENFTFILDTGQWVGSPSRTQGVPDPDIDTYEFMEQTAPYASYVRAKVYKVDSGREEWLDYERIVKILKAANFNGCMSITFEGKDVNECDDKETFRRAAKYLRELLAA